MSNPDPTGLYVSEEGFRGPIILQWRQTQIQNFESNFIYLK